MKIIMDFETLSTISLKEAGAEVYAMHPETKVLCLCYRSEDGNLQGTWTPGDDTWALLELIHNPTYTFEAHNAWFEQMVWKHKMMPLGLPEIPIARWSCSAATALYHGLPGSLADGARVMYLDEGKDKEGSALTVSLSKKMTKKDLTQYGTQENRIATVMPRVISYCQSDCRVEANLSAALGPLSGYERKVWELDQVINRRGLRLDRGFIAAARKVVAGATEEMTIEFQQLTNLSPTQDVKVREWCREQGVNLDSLNKATLARYGIGVDGDWEASEDDDEAPLQELPPHVRRALEIRSMVGSASIKKLPRMQASIGEGGRSRGLVQYYGSHTGRWAGRLWQPHNLPRGLITVRNDKGKLVPPDPEQLRQVIMSGDHRFVASVYGDAIRAVATNLRSAVIPSPGHIFFDGDFSGIEMRTVLAVAGQTDKLELLAAGADVYLDMACDIYGLAKGSLTKDDVEKRTIGKNTVLGCGFQMGPGTFYNRYLTHRPYEPFEVEYEDKYGNVVRTITVDKFAYDVVETYRKVWADKVRFLWYAVGDASLSAVLGWPKDTYGLRYEREGSRWLVCVLPDGQRMYYLDPRYVPGSKQQMDHDAWSFMTGHRSQHAYGGLLTENLVQKLARGFLCEAMDRLEHNNMPVVMHVHDSILCEVPEKGADFQAFKDCMTEDPYVVREGIYPVPIAIDGHQADRWRK